jgi:uncharacterized membrane protein YidH (DUF202 family)
MTEFAFEDWLIGFSSLSIVLVGYCIGLIYLWKSRKLRIKLLTYYSIASIFATTGWLPIVIEFFSVLITGNSIDKVLYVYIMWINPPIAALIMYYIAAKLVIPNRKLYFLIPLTAYLIFIVFGTIVDPFGSVIFIEPPATSFIHKAGLNPSSIGSFLSLVNFIILIIVGGFGYLRRGYKSKGVIRRKYYYLSISIILLVGFGMLDSFTSGFVLVLVRIGALSSYWFAFLGLREEPENITKRPKLIPEAKVSFHKERKICLVCKGNVSRVNYICPKCNTLYCIKCSEGLSNLENMCWVCNEPFDETKPVRPYKEEIEDLKISKKDKEDK